MKQIREGCGYSDTCVGCRWLYTDNDYDTTIVGCDAPRPGLVRTLWNKIVQSLSALID